jgi:hypothetical protein
VFEIHPVIVKDVIEN